jgi:anti-sigma-K factor RskA
MDRPLTHDETAELLGVYAIDAVEGDEAAAVERHLATCPRCTEEVARHHQTTALLANTGSDAPAELWEQISARLGPRPTPPAANYDIGRLRTRRRAVRAAAGGLAAAAAIAIALLGFEVGRLDHRVGQLTAASHRQVLSQALEAALVDPHSQRIALTGGPSGSSGSRQAAELVVLPSGAGYLFDSRLAALPANDTYQLWALVRGQPISVGLLGTQPAIVAFSVSTAGPRVPFAITVESAGGAVAPTQSPVARSTT